MFNKIRAGAYINVTGNTTLSVEAGTRGTVAIPLILDYGAEGEFLTISNGSDALTKLAHSLSDSQMLPIREALKNANTVKVWRVNSGTKASASSENLTATAKYNGARGNDLGVIITSAGEKYTVSVLLDGSEVEFFTASKVEDVTSAYVELTGSLEACTLVLENGSTTSDVSYATFFEACKTEDFEVICYTGTDSAIITQLQDFVKDQRDKECKKIVGVYGSTTNTADHEGLIVVANGVVLVDGTILDKNAVCAWVAGAEAGSQVTESCTFKVYENAVSADVKMNNSQIENAIESGLFVFSAHGQNVVAEYDINSLIRFTAKKPEYFRKNKVIRVLDSIANDIKSMYEAHFIGKIQNNVAGRSLLKDISQNI